MTSETEHLNDIFCDETCKKIKSLLFGKSSDNLSVELSVLHTLIQTCNFTEDSLHLINSELIEEINEISNRNNIRIYFGNRLRDIKCVIQDQSFREHELFIDYKGPRKLCISLIKLPHTSLQHREYTSLEDIITAFITHINDLASYFEEIELIDEHCTVVEPVQPSFKDEYRKILLDDRVWLHVEVTPEGLATNIHLVGQSELWQNKLQEGLLSWDHDKSIIHNIMNVFEISKFPKSTKNIGTTLMDEENYKSDTPTCSICLCVELPDVPGVPQPLCQNKKCGVYYHRTCLYQWLLACAGNLPPAFGVATGSCPTCLQPIVCNEEGH